MYVRIYTNWKRSISFCVSWKVPYLFPLGYHIFLFASVGNFLLLNCSTWDVCYIRIFVSNCYNIVCIFSAFVCLNCLPILFTFVTNDLFISLFLFQVNKSFPRFLKSSSLCAPRLVVGCVATSFTILQMQQPRLIDVNPFLLRFCPTESHLRVDPSCKALRLKLHTSHLFACAAKISPRAFDAYT